MKFFQLPWYTHFCSEMFHFSPCHFFNGTKTAGHIWRSLRVRFIVFLMVGVFPTGRLAPPYYTGCPKSNAMLVKSVCSLKTGQRNGMKLIESDI